MKKFKLWHISILFISVFFISCSNTILVEDIDKNIPKVTNIKTLVDVGSVGFEWDAINDLNVRGYVVYRDSGDGYKEIAYIDNPFSSHFSDDTLSPERTYSYYFHTRGAHKYSERSDIINMKTSFINPVENLFASNDYPKKVKLLWSPHPNPSVSHYLVQRQENGEFRTIALINNRLIVEYIDEGLNDESSYVYRIVAMDYKGNPSRPSKIVVAKTRARPESSTNVSATTDLPRSIVVSWESVPKAAGYKVYRANSEDGSYRNVGSAKDTRFVDNDLETNASFYYKVSAVDSTHIESELSPAARGSTRGLPKTPKITKGYVDKNSSKIEWEAVPNAQYYVVNRKDGLFNVMRFKVTKTSFNDNDMVIGKEYTYFVVSVDDAGLESTPSEEVVLSIK